ncbi:MAG: hypothetical protein ACYTHM_03100 [Planctomycetota bacterium]|jgi:hypothetical protein
MDMYLGVAKDMKITDEELGAVQAIVMAVSAGRVKMQVKDVQARRREGGGEKDIGSCGG